MAISDKALGYCPTRATTSPPLNIQLALLPHRAIMEQAMKSWELENSIKLVDPTRDALYNYDADAQKALGNAKPWKGDPHHFQHVRISAVAMLKMVMHARAGGAIEVMGIMLGYVREATFVVTDALRLPVEGTETRVNAQDEANEYLVQYLERARDAGQLENAVGWYHSHPGYGCWLSGIDVGTQATQQTFGDPFLAVVIDPDRTVSAGKVEIGAFRTYPEGYKPEAAMGGGGGASSSSASNGDGFQTIPLGKIEDFGAHSDRYYALEVSHYKSTLDSRILESLWNKYWVGTLSSSPLLTNRDYVTNQIADLARKVHEAELARNGFGMGLVGKLKSERANTGEDERLEKLARAAAKITQEERTGLLAAEVKEKVFVGRSLADSAAAAAAPAAVQGDDGDTEMKA
ncbi:cop9 signalosome complex subunit 5 [Diplodia corticola]|uniref:COP9 signalosome complex subunit 5 n=1 Tax=Diplodia corticola TaxID=236234 RepID=A0A1J9RSJ3_9PEZI|nr:cop9 signalosome complex subunit 5 [Diplodia corticola]OJD30493.1 cop9 signalosome complex subunit 5 [Diplodia corticola]